MTPPAPQYLHGDVTLQELVEAFNQFQRDVIKSLSDSASGVNRVGIQLKVNALGACSTLVKTGLRGTVSHLVPSRMRRKDGAAIQASWGWDWSNVAADTVSVTFFGLVDSSDYVCNLIMIE